MMAKLLRRKKKKVKEGKMEEGEEESKGSEPLL